MISISIDEIGRDLPGYLRRVEAGETVVILRDGKPVAEVRPASSETNDLRPFGLCAGEFVVPDDFDAPLPDSVLNEFEGR
ncbi:MAG TPA: type II toxin-antitoxin system prevent-host-death family antitoxin [Chloroflexia bacterium]|jgi:prevent-host-death family protein